MMKITKCLPAFFLILCGLSACSGKRGAERVESKSEFHPAFLAGVKTVKAVSGNMEAELTLSGKVEYDPERVVRYTSLVSGIVERTRFSTGDKVRKGQELLELRSAEINALLSDKISLEAETDVAERDLQQKQALYDDKLLSEKELVEAKSKLRQVKAAYAKVKGDMSPFIDKGDGLFAVLSPVDGHIVDKRVASGTPVAPDGNPLFVVADLSVVWIMANVYAGNLQFVDEGMPVEVTTLSYPGEVFTGKIDALSQVFDAEEKVLKARIVMKNDGLRFKPEMSVVVRLKRETGRAMVSVPSDALIFDDNACFAVVETAPAKFEARRVQVEGHYRDTSYLADGLDEGDNVVVKYQLLIYSGLKGE